MYAKLFGCHFRSCNTVCYLLESDIARIVGAAVIGLLVDAKGEKPQSSVEPMRCLSIYLAAATN